MECVKEQHALKIRSKLVINGLKRLLHTSTQMANFGHFLGKMGKTGIFFKKAVGKFFSLLKALINSKVSEKSNERFSSNRVTDVQMYGQTNERESLGLQRLRLETKKVYGKKYKK